MICSGMSLTLATKFELDLEEVAEQNLAKCEGAVGIAPGSPPFDADSRKAERFPRRFLIDFATTHDKDENPFVRVYYRSKPFGDELTDNSPRRRMGTASTTPSTCPCGRPGMVAADSEAAGGQAGRKQ